MTKALNLESLENTTFENLSELINPPYDFSKIQTALLPILTLDSSGDHQKIDAGLETYVLANTLFENYPNAMSDTIVATDLEAYRLKHGLALQAPLKIMAIAEKPTTEEPVGPIIEKFLDQLKTNQSLNSLTIDGKKWVIGFDDVNGFLNDRLQAEGSSNRVFLAQIRPAQYAGVYGKPTTETKENLGAFSPRRIYMKTPLKIVGFDSGYLAINDHISTIVVLGTNLQTTLTTVIDNPIPRSFFRSQQTLVSAAIKKDVPIDSTNIEIMSEIVLAHERGHFAITQQHGFETSYLKQSMNQLKQYKLDQMNEIYADVYALEHLINLNKTDPQKARKAFLIWTSLCVPQSPLEIAIGNLLLSCVGQRGDSMSIDWSKLESKTRKLKTQIQNNFAEIKRNIQLDICSRTLGSVKAKSLTPTQVNATYERFFQQVMDGFKKDHPEYSEIRLRQETVARLVQIALEIQDTSNQQPLALSYAIKIEGYARKVDEFFLQDLALPETYVPFHAMNVQLQRLPQ